VQALRSGKELAGIS